VNTLIDKIFANLDTWRHFPAYQLERRADIFFSIYLPEYLKSVRGYDVRSVIPEFPIRVGTIHSKKWVNKSFKIDYLITLRNPNQILFVELKTDQSSRRPKQDWYLKEARKAGMPALLDGLRKIYHATDSANKYRHLLRALKDAGLIRSIGKTTFDIIEDKYKISILYLQPKGRGKKIITFIQLADFVGKNRDELSSRFSQSLREWAKRTPGANGV